MNQKDVVQMQRIQLEQTVVNLLKQTIDGMRSANQSTKIIRDLIDAQLNELSETNKQAVIKYLKSTDSAFAEVRFVKEFLQSNEELRDNDLLLSYLKLEAKKKGFALSLIEDALEIVKAEEQKEEVEKLKEKLKYDNSCDSDAFRFINEVSSADIERKLIEMQILRHYIWQAKRKLYNLKCDYHIMPIFYGPQGSGKTTAVKMLLSPLDNFSNSSAKFSCFSDQRESFFFKNYYALFFDEMSSASKAEVELIKAGITSEEIVYRKLGENRSVRIKNNASFIACTNKPFTQQISDSSGARRFFEVKTNKLFNFDKVNAIDYLKIWKSVDESGPAPILPILNEISKIQDEELRTKSSIELFFEEIKSDENAEEIYVLAKDLYENYQIFCKNSSYIAFNKLNFYNEVNSTHERIRKTKGNFYKINANKNYFSNSFVEIEPEKSEQRITELSAEDLMKAS